MVIQKSYTGDARIFSKLTSIVLTTWGATFMLSIAMGTFYLGHLPVYGIDNDPNSLNSFILDTIQLVNLFSLFFSFFAFLAWPVLIIHLLINRVSLTRTEKLLQLSALFSIILFFMFKYIWTEQFLWHLD